MQEQKQLTREIAARLYTEMRWRIDVIAHAWGVSGSYVRELLDEAGVFRKRNRPKCVNRLPGND